MKGERPAFYSFIIYLVAITGHEHNGHNLRHTFTK